MRHLRLYQAILTIAKHGSIRKAAEILAVSPSALNRSIQGFEEELAAPIFERVPGGVRLSSAGELLVDLLHRHLVEFEEYRGLLSDLRGGQKGTLRLSIASDLMTGLLPALLAEFCRSYPAISVDVMADDTIGRLTRRDVEIAILTAPRTDDHVEVLFAHPVPLVAIAAGFAPDEPPPAALWELARHRLVLPPVGTGTRLVLGHLFRKHRLADPVVTTLPGGAPPSGTVTAPEIRICPETSLDPGAAGPPPETLPIDLGAVQLTVLRRKQATLPRPTQAFLKLLQARLETR